MAGTISSAGIGSGLDVANIVSKLVAAEQVPLTKMQYAASDLQSKLSAFGQMQSLTSALKDATTALKTADSYAATAALSSDSGAVTATSTTKAAPGSYSIAVTTLASAQTAVSAAGQFSASTDSVGTGSITIRLGSWDAGSTAFTPKTASTDIVIPIGATEDTLAGIRDKINAAGAGVTASIITDANGARLAFRSTATGADNGFRITVADDDTNHSDNLGLSRLAYDPAGGAGQLTRTQNAANTDATINGIAVSSSGTTLTDVVEGTTFTLGKITTTPVVVTVNRDTNALNKLLSGFVSAFNALNTFLTQNTKYDSTAKAAGPLQGDSTAVGIQNQLRSAIGQAGTGSSVFTTLSSIGIEFQKDGSLKLNDTKVKSALTNLPELQKALAGDGTDTTSNVGLAKRLTTLADRLLGTDGTLPSKAKAIQARIDSNQKDQDRFSTRLAAIQARLQKQYSALDSTMSKANALSQYVSQQITTWNNIKVNG